MTNLIITDFVNENFLNGCVGAIAPEALRLYNLRSERMFRWSFNYLICLIPFILIGGCVAWFLEPTTRWAAFYSGLTAPVLLSTALKDSAKAQKELTEIENEHKRLKQRSKELAEIENEHKKLKQRSNINEERMNKLKKENQRLQLRNKNFQLRNKEIQSEIFNLISQKSFNENQQLPDEERWLEIIRLTTTNEVHNQKEIQEGNIQEEFLTKETFPSSYSRYDLSSHIVYEQERLSSISRKRELSNTDLQSPASSKSTKRVKISTVILWTSVFILISIFLIAVFAKIDTNIAFLILFFVFCNTIIAPKISNNEFLQRYFEGL